MTPIAAMVRELLEKGVAAEAIVIAVEGAERAMIRTVSGGSPVDISAEKRRAYDRERKAREREIHRTSGGDPRTSEITSLSEEEKKESKEERKRETTRGSRLPVGWTPADQDWQGACQLIGEPKARSELEKFRDHWAQQAGARGVKLDWNAAWRNWIRRAAEYSTPRNGTQNGRRTVHDAANDLVARLQAFDEPAPGGICGGTGEGAIRLLPPR